MRKTEELSDQDLDDAISAAVITLRILSDIAIKRDRPHAIILAVKENYKHPNYDPKK